MDLRWRVELLGGLRMQRGDQVVTHFRTRQTALLLAYLAFYRHQSHPREQLIELLWPESPLDLGRKSLGVALSSLRQQLEPSDLPRGAVLLADRASVRLNPSAAITDVAELKAALRYAGRAGSSGEQIQFLTQAVDRYRGELLPGYHESWILQERGWLAELYFQALGQLLSLLEQAGDYRRALQYAQRGVRLDPLREEAHRDLIRLYAAVGQHSAALHQYQELERLLKEELRATPTAASRALVHEIERLAVLHPLALAALPPFGLPLSPSADEPALTGAGENRLVTVLFAQMRRSVPATAGTSPQRAATLVSDMLTAVVDVLLKYEGRVDHLMGDRVVAVFGVPHAHEDDPERAILAALEIRAAGQRLGWEVTAGIDSGEGYVSAAPPGGGPSPTLGHRSGTAQAAVERSSEPPPGTTPSGWSLVEAGHGPGPASVAPLGVVGPVVGVAARLQGQARPGQILVGEASYGQTRRAFDFSPLSVRVQDQAGPVVAYVVERAVPRPEKARGIEGLRSELIGRDEELAKLKRALEEVLEGRGQLVSLIGEAGVGKSRLVAELKALVTSDESRVTSGDALSSSLVPRPSSLLWLEGRCHELTRSVGYSLFVDLFRGYFAWRPEEDTIDRSFGAVPERGARARGERLVACLRELVHAPGSLSAERVEEIGPLLGNLLSARFDTDWDDRLKNLGPEPIKQRTFVAVRDFFVALAQRQPVVLVLEDLHWADSLSLDLISFLMESLTGPPPRSDVSGGAPALFLLCVYRPERAHPCRHLAALAARKCPEHSTEIRLQELLPSQSRRLVESLLEIEELPASAKEIILEKVRGNPFFVEELLRSLIAAGMIYRDGRVWRAREGITSISLPESIQSVIRSRVDRLGRELKRVLQAASVIGALFQRRLLESLTQGQTDLERLLWELEDYELIYRERAIPEEEYSFKHVLMQETIYRSIPRPQRAALHQKVAEALEALHPEGLEEQYEQLAYHYERSGDDEKAIEYLLKAGEKARRAYLNDAAAGYLERALERLERPEPGEAGSDSPREERKAPDLELRSRVVDELWQAYSAQGRSERSEALLEEYIERCRRSGYPVGEAHGCYWFSELLLRGHEVQAGSERAARVEVLLQRAIDLCRRHRLGNWIVKPLLDLAFHYWVIQQNLPQQEELLREITRDLDRLEPRDLQQALTLLIDVYAAQGRWEEAHATFTRALAHGGPNRLYFHLLLARWEERLWQEGKRDWFVTLCREWQAQALAAGCRDLPVQWFLAAARPAPAPGPPLLDLCFAENPLPPELTWVDPAGIGVPDLRPGERLTLAPPHGPNLWPPSNLNAPRLMLSVAGDFIAETRVEIGEAGKLFANLLLWKSERDFIRLDRVRTSVHGNGVQLEACASGRFVQLGRGRFPARSVWLRLERHGNNVRALCSEGAPTRSDGPRQWWTCGSGTFPEGGTVTVGIACIAETVGGTASFERLTVWGQATDEVRG